MSTLKKCFLFFCFFFVFFFCPHTPKWTGSVCVCVCVWGGGMSVGCFVCITIIKANKKVVLIFSARPIYPDLLHLEQKI